jgi:hypothetical protein
MTNKIYYILEGKVTIPIDDIITWAKQYETSNRIVAQSEIAGIHISTVFFGLNRNFSGEGEPILFETMIFGGKYNGYTGRYSTWDEAEEGHRKACELVLNSETSKIKQINETDD